MRIAPASRRLATIATAATLTVSCIGPQGSHREGKSWPTEPSVPFEANLYGQVLDLETGAPIEGAKVNVGIDSAVTKADGLYNLQGLRAQIVQVVTSHPRYDSTTAQIPLPDGDMQWVIRLRPKPTVWMDQ
jgi:hypothetical protein